MIITSHSLNGAECFTILSHSSSQPPCEVGHYDSLFAGEGLEQAKPLRPQNNILLSTGECWLMRKLEAVFAHRQLKHFKYLVEMCNFSPSFRFSAWLQD